MTRPVTREGGKEEYVAKRERERERPGPILIKN